MMGEPCIKYKYTTEYIPPVLEVVTVSALKVKQKSQHAGLFITPDNFIFDHGSSN